MQTWLSSFKHGVDAASYRHRLYSEKPNARIQSTQLINDLVFNAHSDAIDHLNRLIGNSLDPIQSEQPVASTFYPHGLPLATKKGYFGELLAGAIAENFSPLGVNWKVPAYLFRFHTVAFQTLESLRNEEEINAIPGRTGDDCIAFSRDEHGTIRKCLFCEAKCTGSHDSSMISEAHEQISSSKKLPVDLMRLKEILVGRSDEESRTWSEAIQELYLKLPTDYERCDFIAYVYGQKPILKKAWISCLNPHPKYIGGRRLEVAEIYLSGLDSMVQTVYDNLRDPR